MLSLKLKPALVSVVVTAGLLAAAAPASAQILDGPILAKAGPQAPKPSVVVIDLDDPFFKLFKGELIGLEPNALGTQVGSEGVKANNLRGEAIDIIP